VGRHLSSRDSSPAPRQLSLGLTLTNPSLYDTLYNSMRQGGSIVRTGRDGHPSPAVQAVPRQSGTQTSPPMANQGGSASLRLCDFATLRLRSRQLIRPLPQTRPARPVAFPSNPARAASNPVKASQTRKRGLTNKNEPRPTGMSCSPNPVL